MEPLSKACASMGGCRVIAFDRPPFGLTERPLSWEGGDAQSPYSTQVRILLQHIWKLRTINITQYSMQHGHRMRSFPNKNAVKC